MRNGNYITAFQDWIWEFPDQGILFVYPSVTEREVGGHCEWEEVY